MAGYASVAALKERTEPIRGAMRRAKTKAVKTANTGAFAARFLAGIGDRMGKRSEVSL